MIFGLILLIPSSQGQVEGLGWNVQEVSETSNFNDIYAIDRNHAIAVTEDGNVVQTLDNGTTWTSATLASNLNSLDHVNSTVFMVGNGGKVFRLNLANDNVWEDVSIPSTTDLYDVSIAEFNLNNQSNGIVYVSGSNGEIWKSTTSGDSWGLTTSGVSIALFGIDFLDQSFGIAVGQDGTIIGTSDGSTWEQRAIGETVAVDLFDIHIYSEIRAYVVGAMGTFLRSTKTQADPFIGFNWELWDTGTNQDLNGVYAGSVNKVFAVGNNGTVLRTTNGGVTVGSTIGFSQQLLPESGQQVDFQSISMAPENVLFGWVVGNGGTVIFTETEGIAESEVETVKNYDNWGNFLDLAIPILNDGFIGMSQVIFISMVMGFIIGITMATAKIVPNTLINLIGTLYTDIIRNTPLLVQLFIIHFGLPEIGIKIEIEGYSRGMISGILGLGINSGAYQAEIIRSGILAIPQGQMEAGRSLGLTYGQTMRHIILPQALRLTIPPLGNELVNLTLNSSLLFVVGFQEITRSGRLIIAVTFKNFRTYSLVAAYYFVVTYALTNFLRWLEKRTRIPGLGGAEAV